MLTEKDVKLYMNAHEGNPYHGADGKFTTGPGGSSMTYRETTQKEIPLSERVKLDTEDQVVVTFHKGKEAYKGMEDYEPMKDESWKWNEDTKSYLLREDDTWEKVALDEYSQDPEEYY